jgi:hypothetical protein
VNLRRGEQVKTGSASIRLLEGEAKTMGGALHASIESCQQLSCEDASKVGIGDGPRPRRLRGRPTTRDARRVRHFGAGVLEGQANPTEGRQNTLGCSSLTVGSARTSEETPTG